MSNANGCLFPIGRLIDYIFDIPESYQIQNRPPAEPTITLNNPITPQIPNYKSRSGLFTPTEERFYQALRQAISPQYLIAPKVRLLDIFDAPRNRPDLFNKISRKHIDFLICDSDGKFVVGIELDDRSHLRLERQQRDEFVNGLFRDAAIPLIRFKARGSYDIVAIRERLQL